MSKTAKRAARELVVQGSLLGIGIPGACLIALATIGALLYPVMGAAGWQPAFELAIALGSAPPAPLAILAAAFLVLAAVGSFDGWRRWQLSSGKFDNLDQQSLTVAERLVKLISSPFLPVKRVPSDTTSCALPLHPPERTLVSTPAGLSGALPLLE